MFIFVRLSNLIFFNLTWKRNWSKIRNAPSQEIRSDRYSGQWSQILCHSSLSQSMWLLWPIEYCGSIASRTSSFYFLPLGVHPPCLKEAQATTQKRQQEGILRHLANSHNGTPSQQPASTLPAHEWVILEATLPAPVDVLEATPPAPIDTRHSRDKLSLLWALPKLPNYDQIQDCCVLSH